MTPTASEEIELIQKSARAINHAQNMILLALRELSMHSEQLAAQYCSDIDTVRNVKLLDPSTLCLLAGASTQIPLVSVAIPNKTMRKIQHLGELECQTTLANSMAMFLASGAKVNEGRA